MKESNNGSSFGIQKMFNKDFVEKCPSLVIIIYKKITANIQEAIELGIVIRYLIIFYNCRLLKYKMSNSVIQDSTILFERKLRKILVVIFKSKPISVQ